MGPDGPSEALRLTARDVFAAIEALRNETRESRHLQANATTRAIAELDDRIDVRLRTLEVTLAASMPSTLGPRINDLETWRAEMRGSLQTLRIALSIMSGVSILAGLVALLKP